MPSDPIPDTAASKRPTVRWWPAWAILILTGLGITAIRLWPGFSFQEKNIRTAAALLLAVGLVMMWTLALSRLRWRTRLLTVALTLTCIAFVAGSLRIRGVSGDLLPILEWRFKQKAAPKATAVTRPPIGTATAQPAGTPSTFDYPQFLGPRRTGVAEGPKLAPDWQAQPPTPLWRQAIGPAWSGFAVSGPYAITMEQTGEQERVTCYDLLSGKLLWSHADSTRYNTTIAGEGPRTTPTIADRRVFTMGAKGLLNCLDLSTGQRVWSKDVPTDNQGTVGEWGVSCSPLVVSNLVIVSSGAGHGRSLCAYHSSNGERAWASGDDPASYSSPVSVRIDGRPQILVFNANSVAAHALAHGQPLWGYPWRAGHPHITTPLLIEHDRLLVSSGYGTGSELLRISQAADDKWTAHRLWKSNRLKSKFANVLYRAGHIYGLDDGILVCLEAATGRLVWKEGRYGHGQMIASEDMLLIMAENGDVVLVQMSPQAHRELTRFEALSGKTWNPPALAGRYLLVRNDVEAACFVLPTR